MNAAGPAKATRYTGRPASSGLARGPLHRLVEEKPAHAVDGGAPEHGSERLERALGAARAELILLAAGLVDPEAAGILEFQVALIEDDALTEGVFAAVAAGTSADRAWAEAMAAMAAEYAGADDEYFRARAADLEDLASRVAAHLAGRPTGAVTLPPGAILLARDLTPSRFLAGDWSAGRAIALTEGSPTAHLAILARARGVPMVVGLGSVDAEEGTHALLDGTAGSLVVAPGQGDEGAFARLSEEAERERRLEVELLHRPAATAAGTTVKVMINAGDPAELDGLDPSICDGIGLVRTEFLFHGRTRLPGEDEQVAAYRRLLAWAGRRPVVVRTLDAGGDKPVEGLTRTESNPFLGLRGIRLSLARPDVFRVQVRALLRAAADGPLHVMVPMVALPAEMADVRALFSEEESALSAARIPHAMPPLGMMVEVPAAALALDLFDVDFVSIGSNDLTQYVMAASREAGDLGKGLDDAGAVAVMRMVEMVVRSAEARKIPVSLCGDAGSDPAVLPKLLAAGLTSVSVAPAAVGRVKRVIAGWGRAEVGRAG
jgi:phosphotransferase system enzyme I (PtsI)